MINSCYGGFLFAFILTQNLKYIDSIFLPLDVTSVLMKSACEPISSLNLKGELEAELRILFIFILHDEESHIIVQRTYWPANPKVL